MQLEMSVTLDANLSLQCGLSGPTSTMCNSDVLPPRWPAATREELFGVLSHSLQGRFQTLQIPVEAHCRSISVCGTPNRQNIGFRLSMILVLEVELKITTSKYLLK